jgi:hypothetical protein
LASWQLANLETVETSDILLRERSWHNALGDTVSKRVKNKAPEALYPIFQCIRLIVADPSPHNMHIAPSKVATVSLHISLSVTTIFLSLTYVPLLIT